MTIKSPLTSPGAPCALHQRDRGENKLPSSSSSSPALIAHRMQSTVVWDRRSSVRTSAPGPSERRESVVAVCGGGCGKMTEGSRRQAEEHTAAVRKCFGVRERAHSLTHSLPVTFCLLVWVSNSHRPQRPAAHLPLKGRGTDFQVAAVGTHTHSHAGRENQSKENQRRMRESIICYCRPCRI